MQLKFDWPIVLENLRRGIMVTDTALDLVIGILGGEEDPRREFIGFLKEYEKR